MHRRTFVTGAVAAAGGAFLGACSARPTPEYPETTGLAFEGTGPFPAGVGSADPTATSVLLWTRAHPERDPGSGIDLRVEVATSPSFAVGTLVVDGPVTAAASRDHCVVLDATGLQPATTYWYRFSYDGRTSPVGRTRTAPAPGTAAATARIAAFSCQRWTHGFFNAHADLAALAEDPGTDVDLVLCLGDYVYETGFADKVYVPGREDPVQRASTRDEFRSKYRLYRSDPDLQAVHAAYPVVHVFDNHDGLSQPGDTQGPGALAAFFEHVALRSDAPGRIHRSLRWGDTAEVFLTDQRQYRDPTLEENGPLGTSTDIRPEILDPGRTMLGQQQRQWLMDGLAGSTAQWKVIGSQLMFWPWRTFGRFPWQPRGAGVYLNMTQWDGYAAERLALLDHLEQADVRDTLLLSGDSHVFSAAQVAPDVDDPYSVPRVAEFGTGSVTSNNADENDFPTDDVTGPFLSGVNPYHLRFFESERHGYVVADLAPDATTVQVRSPRTILERSPEVDVLATFRVPAGTQRVDLVT